MYLPSFHTHVYNERSVVDVWEQKQAHRHLPTHVMASVRVSPYPPRTQKPHFRNLACWVRKSPLILTKSAEGPFGNTYKLY